MTHLCIIVYNRIDNLRHWLLSLSKFSLDDVGIIIIHNIDNENEAVDITMTRKSSYYITRPNIGFDLGAFQDVCMGRLKGFPKDWERILWVTDDTLPMSTDFIQQFNEAMKPGIGVACMQISPYVRAHIRTTGFMIDRHVAEKLKFPVETIMTKEHCYLFEHRDVRNTFYNQIISMGLKVVQVAPNETSPLWDIGYKRKLDRKEEHEKLFGKIIIAIAKEDAVTFICPIYNSYPAIISALIMQTNPNWVLWLIHDGKPYDRFIEDYVNRQDDIRIIYMETEKHYGNWGHQIRSEYLKKVKSKYVVITNPDNYIVPVYVEYMLQGFKEDTVGVYCSQMIHSYKKWQVINCSLQRGYIDCSGMVLKTNEAQKIGWNNITDHSADWIFFNDLHKKYGMYKFVKVNGCLLIHN